MFGIERKSEAEKKRLRDEKNRREYNQRQEYYDDKLRNAKQKNRFKTMLAKLKFETYTKRLVAIITIVGLIDLQLSYVLAFMDKMQIAETLSGQICVTILGTALIYMIRAYFDSKAEHNNGRIDKVNEKTRKQIESDVMDKVRDILSNSGLSQYVNIGDVLPDDHSEVNEAPEEPIVDDPEDSTGSVG